MHSGAAQKLTPLSSSPLTALLADADDDTRMMYAQCLRVARYDVDEAVDGREALAKALAHKPNIFVTEMRLPGISGLDLCWLLRRDALTAALPILVITTDAYEINVQRLYDAGASAVLVKPCLPDALVTEINELLEHSRDLRDRSEHVREGSEDHLARAVQATMHAENMRATLTRSHNRFQTTTPSIEPPALVCPQCDGPLTYDRSHIGGVSARHSEQWDYYSCPAGCGTFQYRQRTRRLRRV